MGASTIRSQNAAPRPGFRYADGRSAWEKRPWSLQWVGREGFVGWPILLGDGRWPYDVTLRATTTTALMVEAQASRRVLDVSAAARDLPIVEPHPSRRSQPHARGATLAGRTG